MHRLTPTDERAAPRLLLPGVVALLEALLLAACGPSATCTSALIQPAAAATLSAVRAQLDFTPSLPCSFDRSVTVSTVFIDRMPAAAGSWDPRINFALTRAGDGVFVLSETRAPVPFTAIPQGTHPIHVTAAGITAQGFSGPSGSGTDTTYLRWRRDGVTFELNAATGRWMTEADAIRTARAMIEAAAPASADERPGAGTPRPQR